MKKYFVRVDVYVEADSVEDAENFVLNQLATLGNDSILVDSGLAEGQND
jgi:hypothetical protein